MDTQTQSDQQQRVDPISRDLHEAVTAHESASEAERASYARELLATIDDLLERMGPRH